MSQPLPADWATKKQVPTSTLHIKGKGGDIVATINVVGTATVTTAYPYTHS